MNRQEIRALLLDFDGVLADTEPVHLRFFAELLGPEGISLSREAYFAKYLGLDDRSCFRKVFADAGRELDPALEESLVRRKNQQILEYLNGKSVLLPGVADFLRNLQGRYYLAIVSGALRSEIEAVLRSEGLAKLFHLIVGADQVARGKPDPEGFITAMKLLNRDHVPESEILLPVECLAVEDSPWGIEAAKKAGVRVAAVTTSYPKEKLSLADEIIGSLAEVISLLDNL